MTSNRRGPGRPRGVRNAPKTAFRKGQSAIDDQDCEDDELMSSVGRRYAVVPGRYREDAVGPLEPASTIPSFRHERIPFNPNLPQAAFPSFSEPLSRAEQDSSMYFINGVDTRPSRVSQDTSAEVGFPPESATTEGNPAFTARIEPLNKEEVVPGHISKIPPYEEPAEVVDKNTPRIRFNPLNKKLLAKGEPGNFDAFSFDLMCQDEDEVDPWRPRYDLKVSDRPIKQGPYVNIPPDL
jgi:hypothetical protein